MIRPIRNASTPMITKTIIASTKIVALCSKGRPRSFPSTS
jgi:hypothetical protein